MNQMETSSLVSRSPASPPGRKPWVGAVAAAVLVAATAAASWALLQRAPPARPNRAGAVTVGTAPVVKGDVPVILNGLGTVTPLASVTVKTQISGYLTQVNYKEGQPVHAGDALALIDPRPYELALSQAEGQLIKDQALLAAAQTDLSRYQTLQAQDSIAGQQVDTQRALVRQYQGIVQSDRATVDTSRLNIAYCHIVAPVTGRVGLRLVDPGNYVQPSDATGLVVITQVQPISVIFTLPEDSVAPVIRRLRGGAALTVTALNRSQTATLADGKLVTIDNQIDTATGTLKLRAEFANGDETLIPNQFVNVRLLGDQMRDTVVAPTAAIQRGAPGTFGYQVGAEDVVSVRPVTLGPSSGEKVAVTAGLAPGDVVVTDGADKLRDGAHIARTDKPSGASRGP